MEKMFRVNEQKRKTGSDMSMERNMEMGEYQKHSTNVTDPLKSCKDCDEWLCVTCDNEGCPKQDKEPGCYEGDCTKKGDLKPKCKDCDEWACVTCDNEKK